MTEMKIMWNIDSLINTVSTNRDVAEDLETNISEAMQAAFRHEMLMQSKGHTSKFIRSSLFSREIAHNAYMGQAIGNVVGIKFNSFSTDY